VAKSARYRWQNERRHGLKGATQLRANADLPATDRQRQALTRLGAGQIANDLNRAEASLLIESLISEKRRV
jgi:hypothetical protein